MELWGFTLRGLVTAKFSASPSGETMREINKSFTGARTCSKSSITMPSLVGLGFYPPPGWPKTLSCLSVCLLVCLSVTLLNVRDCASGFAMKALEYRNVLTPLDRGRFVVVHPCSSFSECCQVATPLNAEVQNMAKIVFFAGRGRQNKPIETKFGT